MSPVLFDAGSVVVGAAGMVASVVDCVTPCTAGTVVGRVVAIATW